MEKHLQVWSLKWNLRPVLFDILAAMYVTCYMFLKLCLVSVRSVMISAFKKSTFLKQKSLRPQKKSLISW